MSCVVFCFFYLFGVLNWSPIRMVRKATQSEGMVGVSSWVLLPDSLTFTLLLLAIVIVS